MRASWKRGVIALLCLTALAALPACMSAELVAADSAPQTGSAAQVESASLAEPGAAAESGSVQAAGDGAGADLPHVPTPREAMQALEGHFLNEQDEIAAMRAAWNVRDARADARSVVDLWRVGDGFAATYPCMDGEFYARYDEDLRRESFFYAPYPDGSRVVGPDITLSCADLDGGWSLVARGVDYEDVGDLPFAAGFAQEDFGEKVDVLCTVSGNGTLRTRELLLPTDRACALTENYLCLYADERKETAFWLDRRTNEVLDLGDIPPDAVRYLDDDIVVYVEGEMSGGEYRAEETLAARAPGGETLWRQAVRRGEGQVGRLQQGGGFITDVCIEQGADLLGDHPDGAVYFFSGTEAPTLGFAQGRIYPALNEALGAFERENYEITCYNGYSVRFLSPTRFEAVLSPCIRYRGENDVFGRDGEYIDVHDYVCVLEVELT